MRIECRLGLTALAWILASAAMAEQPLSAIDWLSKSVAVAAKTPAANEKPTVKKGPVPEDISVSVLDGPSPDGAGLLTAQVTGLPRALWGLGQTEEIAAKITAEDSDTLPALQSLLTTLLLAEATPPADAEGKGTLLLARIDKLLAMGALDQAGALLEAVDTQSVELFRRSFDVALLTGTEDRACDEMRASPNLAPTFPARIFCLARAGDWNAAALTLRTAQALGFVTPEEDALLSRFLDSAMDDDGTELPIPDKPTPLVLRMYEAIGEPLPTNTLPLAFANAELREQAGWKAQIEAAERLARAGAIAPNQLLGIYTARLPAASGGVWDRVEAFQRLDTALRAGDPGAVARYLPAAWDGMTEAELEVPFATLFAADLIRLPLSDEAAALAFRIALLSPDYEKAALARKPTDEMEAFLIGLARGNLKGVMPTSGMARAIAPAFLHAAPAPDAEALLKENRFGEALLWAIERTTTGAAGDLRGVTEGLSLLRHVGLEDVARRTALQLLLLERRG